MNKKVFLAGLFTVMTVFAASAGCNSHHNSGCQYGCKKHTCSCHQCPPPPAPNQYRPMCGGSAVPGICPMPKPAEPARMVVVNGHTKPKPMAMADPKPNNKPAAKPAAQPKQNQTVKVNKGGSSGHTRGNSDIHNSSSK